MDNFKSTENELEKLDKNVDDFNNNTNEVVESSQIMMDELLKEKDQIYKINHNLYQNSKIIFDDIYDLSDMINLRLYLFVVFFTISFLFTRILFNNPYVYILISISSAIITDKYALERYDGCIRKKMNLWKQNFSRSNVSIEGYIRQDKVISLSSKVKNNVNKVISVSSRFIPILDKITNVIEHQNRCYRYFESIDSFISKYGIKSNAIDQNYYEIKYLDPVIDDVDEIIGFYFDRISTYFKISKLSFLLLYYDYIENEERKNYYFELIKSNNIYVGELANFLIKYKITNIYDFNQIELEKMIIYLDNFSLNYINNIIYELNKIKSYTKDIIYYGIENNVIKSDCEFSIDKLLSQENLLINLDGDNYYIILYNYMQNDILSFKNYNKESITKCLIGLTSAHSIRFMLEKASTRIGLDENAIKLMFIYKRLEEDKGEAVWLSDAIVADEDYVKNQFYKYDFMYDELKQYLIEGKWIRSTEYFIKKILDEVRENLIEIKEEKKIVTAAKTVFKSFVSEKTLLQILDSNDTIAYILMWKPGWGTGGLANFINELNENEGYWMTHYTNSSRIGILPPNQTFNEFASQFRSKIKDLPENFVANVIIQRFPTSELYINHIPIGEEYKPPFRIIQDLISNYMPFYRITTYIRYGKIVDKTFFNRPFIEMMNDTIELFPSDRQPIIFRQLLITDATKNLCKEFKCENLIGLKNFIENNLKEDVRHIKRIRDILNVVYPILSNDEINKLAGEFYNKIVAYITASPIIPQ